MAAPPSPISVMLLVACPLPAMPQCPASRAPHLWWWQALETLVGTEATRRSAMLYRPSVRVSALLWLLASGHGVSSAWSPCPWRALAEAVWLEAAACQVWQVPVAAPASPLVSVPPAAQGQVPAPAAEWPMAGAASKAAVPWCPAVVPSPAPARLPQRRVLYQGAPATRREASQCLLPAACQAHRTSIPAVPFSVSEARSAQTPTGSTRSSSSHRNKRHCRCHGHRPEWSMASWHRRTTVTTTRWRDRESTVPPSLPRRGTP